jgi:predicted transcriptional regulator
MPAKKPSTPRPTDAELAILRVLWRRGQATVREVLDTLNAHRDEPFAYTTILRFLQIMTEKKLVVCEGKDRTHVFSASVPAEQTKGHLVRDLMDRLFDGSARELVLQALGTKKVSASELRDIRKLLDQLENK